MAALAINDTADGRRVLALTGRLDATTLPGLWDAARRAAAETPRRPLVIDAAGVEYCDGAGAALFVDLLRQTREGKVEVANLRPAFAALLKQFDPDGARTRSRPRVGAAAGDRRDRFRGLRHLARHPRAGRIRRGDVRGPGVRGASSRQRALEGRLAHLRAGRCRRPADRRADLGAAGHDPRISVGHPDEAVRRGDLRRGSHRLVDAARARSADDGDPACRPVGCGVCGGDRHDARQPGSRRADDDGIEPRPVSRHARGSSPPC